MFKETILNGLSVIDIKLNKLPGSVRKKPCNWFFFSTKKNWIKIIVILSYIYSLKCNFQRETIIDEKIRSAIDWVWKKFKIEIHWKIIFNRTWYLIATFDCTHWNLRGFQLSISEIFYNQQPVKPSIEVFIGKFTSLIAHLNLLQTFMQQFKIENPQVCLSPPRNRNKNILYILPFH